MQTQPLKRLSISHERTASSANAAGGSIVALSTGCNVSSTSRGSSASFPFAAAGALISVLLVLSSDSKVRFD